MEALLHELKTLESLHISYGKILNNYKDKNAFRKAIIDRKISRISNMLCDLLITEKGHCNWEHIEHLETKGYNVGPAEQDRFGWLTGILATKKGDILFG